MDDDYCIDCVGLGDDYFVNAKGELECYCPQCPNNPWRNDEDEEWE
jgi:hypothetical protein